MSNPAIGIRVEGKRLLRQRWYECAVMGCHVPESETVVPEWPHKHAGLRVCFKHLDPLSYNELEMLNPPRTSTTEEGP